MTDEQILEDYSCEFVDLHEIAGTKLHTILTSDHPNGFHYRKNKDRLKIVKIINPDGEVGCCVYDETEDGAEWYLESWIRKYANRIGIAETLAKHLLNK